MKNIWLQRREVKKYKKRKQYIHDVMFPITKLSPLVNCILWESHNGFSNHTILKKHGHRFVDSFISLLESPTTNPVGDNTTLPSYVNFDFTFNNKAIVIEDGQEELWTFPYDDQRVVTAYDYHWAGSSDFSMLQICLLWAGEAAISVRKDILADIDLVKNNNISEYNYYINSIQLKATDNEWLGKGYELQVRHAKSVIFGS